MKNDGDRRRALRRRRRIGTALLWVWFWVMVGIIVWGVSESTPG